MLGDHRQAEDELQHEVAIADGVDAVGRHFIEAQPPGDILAVDRQARAGQRGRPERQTIGPPAAIGQSLPVALELFAVGQPIVRGQHRLGTLHMGIARQDDLGIAFAPADQRPLHIPQPRANYVNRLADPQPQIGRDLIVAAAGGMEFAAHVARCDL